MCTQAILSKQCVVVFMSVHTCNQSHRAAMFSFEYKTVNKVTEGALIEQQHFFCIPFLDSMGVSHLVNSNSSVVADNR